MIYKITTNFKDYTEYTNLLSQLASSFEQPSYDFFKNFIHNLDSNSHIFLFQKDDIIVGTIKIIIEPKLYTEASYVGHIEDVIVDKKYRKKGYGTELMQWAINFCQENKCYKIVLYCSDHNIPFYKSNGFIVDGANLVKRFK